MRRLSALGLGHLRVREGELAAEIIAEHGEPDPDDPLLRYLGGEFTFPDAQVPRA